MVEDVVGIKYLGYVSYFYDERMYLIKLVNGRILGTTNIEFFLSIFNN